MKKYNFILFVYIFCSWIFTSCSEEFEQVGEANSRALTMELSAGEQTENGVEDLNENAINNVSVFFFEDVTKPCIYLKRNLRVGDDKKLKVDLAPEVVDKTCKVYVVANYTSNLSLDDLKGMTLAQIQNVVISTDFKTGENKEPFFVMHGLTENAIKITNGGDGGTVLLKRVASKIVLQPNVASSIESGGITYTPDLTEMTVELVNVAQKAVLNGGELPEGTAQEFISTISRSYSKETDGENYMHIPLYSYPNEWANKEGATETYLNFCIPWYYTKDGTQLSANYYYRVAIGSGKLESNKLYRITADIELLGSIDPEETVKVDASYEILDWKTVDIPADINRYKYLELETNFVEMKNENRVDVGFSSSTEATAKLVEVRFWDYSVTDYYENIVTNEEPPKPSGERPTPPNKDNYGLNGYFWFLDPAYWKDYREYENDLKAYNEVQEKYDAWLKYFGNKEYLINIYGQTLSFEHVLASDVRVPYTYIIEVTNADGLTETLTLVQYPPIYIEGESNKNDGGSNRFVYNSNKEGSISDDNRKGIGSVAHYENGSNHNPNQYTIYATVLDEASEYVIGDPRVSQPTSLSALNSYGSPSGLRNYYPTKDGDEVRNMIAPAFKIASSWGQTTSASYSQLQKRCAAYQENGYPAGRWRIPTEAEIQFVIGLSDEGYIPELFDGDYYASSGRYYSSGSGFSSDPDKNGSHAVRCIYDVWYWGDDKIANPNVFTWGDTDPIRPAN